MLMNTSSTKKSLSC